MNDPDQWQLGAPLDGDRAVSATSDALAGKHIALCVCGGIAAYRAPDLVRTFRKAGAEVSVWVTPTALQFVTADALQWTSLRPVVDALDGRAQHVEIDAVDLWLVAPATYSTINKIAVGVADNAVTTAMASAIGLMEAGRCQVAVVPTMHGSMLNSVVKDSLRRLQRLGVTVLTPRLGEGKARLPEDSDLLADVLRLLG